jgi:hypothetical protein
VCACSAGTLVLSEVAFLVRAYAVIFQPIVCIVAIFRPVVDRIIHRRELSLGEQQVMFARFREAVERAAGRVEIVAGTTEMYALLL